MGAFDWKTDPALNGTVDPGLPVQDGASARTYPAVVREVMAAVRGLSDDIGGAITTSGALNAYIAATASGVTQLRAGVSLLLKVDRSNTDAAFLNVDGTGPKPWVDADGSVFAAGRLKADRMARVTYHVATDAWRTDILAALDNTSDQQKSEPGNPVGDKIAAAVDQRKGGRIVAAQRGLVLSDPASATANRILLNALLAEMAGLGGGTVYASGTVYVDGPIDNKYSGVYLEGPAALSAHDTAFSAYGLTIIPTVDCTGAVDATSPNGRGAVLRHRTPWKAEVGGAIAPARNVGGGFRYVRVIGNGVARRLLEVDSVTYGTYDVYLENPVGYDAAWFRSGVTGTDLGEAADIQYANVNLRARCVEGAGANAHGVTLAGSVNANFSLNGNVQISVQHVNGNALNLSNADNNTIRLTSYRLGSGTGASFIAAAAIGAGSQVYARANTLFLSADSAGYVQGLEASGATSPAVFREIILDTENGTPMPVQGTGALSRVTNVMAIYTPTLVAGGGTLGAGATATGRWSQTAAGHVTARVSIFIPNGSGLSSFLAVGMPIPPRAGVIEGMAYGKEISITGKAVSGIVSGGTANIQYADGTFTGANGMNIRLVATYEV
ncbi:hypothetical protein [Methylobacterium sp. sgz302541]|uniref:hypothetical protein n=1 Tax=unclassified Methylobacterium TaxID=2615210 RepID=UPI003D34DB8B